METTRRNMLLFGAGAILFPGTALAGKKGWTRCSDGSWVNNSSLCIQPTGGATGTTGTSGSTGTTSTGTAAAGTTTTTTATTSATTVDGYSSSLINGFTPKQPNWLGKIWAADMGSTWNANLDHCWRLTSTQARFELHNTTLDHGQNDPSTKRRAELHANKYPLPNGVELWGAYSFVDHAWSDPAGMLALGSGGSHMQMHMPAGGSPAFSFRRYKDGRFSVTTNGDKDPISNNRRYLGALSFDQAHDIVYRFVIDPLHGSLDVWLDGKQIVNLWDASIGTATAGCYACYGLYYGGGVTCPIVTEQGNIAFPSTTSLSSRITRPPWA